jgi:hypothetical protein
VHRHPSHALTFVWLAQQSSSTVAPAEQHRRKVDGFEFLAKVITGARFRDGIEVRDDSTAQTDLVAA